MVVRWVRVNGGRCSNASGSHGAGAAVDQGRGGIALSDHARRHAGQQHGGQQHRHDRRDGAAGAARLPKRGALRRRHGPHLSLPWKPAPESPHGWPAMPMPLTPPTTTPDKPTKPPPTPAPAPWPAPRWATPNSVGCRSRAGCCATSKSRRLHSLRPTRPGRGHAAPATSRQPLCHRPPQRSSPASSHVQRHRPPRARRRHARPAGRPRDRWVRDHSEACRHAPSGTPAPSRSGDCVTTRPAVHDSDGAADADTPARRPTHLASGAGGRVEGRPRRFAGGCRCGPITGRRTRRRSRRDGRACCAPRAAASTLSPCGQSAMLP